MGVVLNRVQAKSEPGYDGYYGSHEAAVDAAGQSAGAPPRLRAAPTS